MTKCFVDLKLAYNLLETHLFAKNFVCKDEENAALSLCLFAFVIKAVLVCPNIRLILYIYLSS